MKEKRKFGVGILTDQKTYRLGQGLREGSWVQIRKKTVLN